MISLYSQGQQKPVAFTKFKTRLEDIHEQWELYRQHWGSPEQPPAPVLTELANRLLYLRDTPLSYAEIPEYINQILRLDPGNQITLFSVCFELKEPVNVGVKKLFHIWRRLIEKATVLYAKSIGVDVSEEQLEQLAVRQGIATSSPIIYYVYSRRPGAPAFDLGITYDYTGFCPKVAVERVRRLLEFPIDRLFAKIPQLDLPLVFADIYSKMLVIFGPQHAPAPAIAASTSTRSTYADPLTAIDAYIHRLDEVEAVISSHESYYLELAQKVDSIAYMIEHEILFTFL